MDMKRRFSFMPDIYRTTIIPFHDLTCDVNAEYAFHLYISIRPYSACFLLVSKDTSVVYCDSRYLLPIIPNLMRRCPTRMITHSLNPPTLWEPKIFHIIRSHKVTEYGKDH